MLSNVPKCSRRCSLKFHPLNTAARLSRYETGASCTSLDQIHPLIRRAATFKCHRPPRSPRARCRRLVAPVQSGLPFISPIAHWCTKPLIQLSSAPIMRCILCAILFDLPRYYLIFWSGGSAASRHQLSSVCLSLSAVAQLTQFYWLRTD